MKVPAAGLISLWSLCNLLVFSRVLAKMRVGNMPAITLDQNPGLGTRAGHFIFIFSWIAFVSGLLLAVETIKKLFMTLFSSLNSDLDI